MKACLHRACSHPVAQRLAAARTAPRGRAGWTLFVAGALALPGMAWTADASKAARPASAQARPAAEAPATDGPLGAELLRAIQAAVMQAAVAQPGLPEGARIEVELGRLDARLKLAPCVRVEHQLAARPWGSSRVAVRCADGGVRWQVQLPVTVRVWGEGWVARAAQPAGTTVGKEQWVPGTVDLASGAVPLDDESVFGRTLARPQAAGEPLRAADLRVRQWFAAGETVQLVAVGPGYRISGQGQALSAGMEGQRVRVRTDSGRIVSGVAVAEGQVEVRL